MADFKDRLNEVFRFCGYTQKELAEMLNISKALMNQYMLGKCSPNSNEKIISIAKFFDVSPAWLAGFDVPMENLAFTDEVTAIVKVFNRLNPVGRRKAKDYMEDLADNEKYLNISAGSAELKRA